MNEAEGKQAATEEKKQEVLQNETQQEIASILPVGIQMAIKREVQKAEKNLLYSLFEQHTLEVSKSTSKANEQVVFQVNKIIKGLDHQLQLLAVDVRDNNQDIYNVLLRVRAVDDVLVERVAELEQLAHPGAVIITIQERIKGIKDLLDARMKVIHDQLEQNIIEKKKTAEETLKAKVQELAESAEKQNKEKVIDDGSKQDGTGDGGQRSDAQGEKAN